MIDINRAPLNVALASPFEACDLDAHPDGLRIWATAVAAVDESNKDAVCDTVTRVDEAERFITYHDDGTWDVDIVDTMGDSDVERAIREHVLQTIETVEDTIADRLKPLWPVMRAHTYLLGGAGDVQRNLIERLMKRVKPRADL
jgi:hypothetical protein